MPDPELGQVPFDEAIRFYRNKLNISTKRWGDLRGEAHARMFTVAGATKGTVLQDIRDAVDDALANGTTITDFRKKFDETVAKNGWNFKGKRGWRTRVIFDTNLRSAHAAGRWEQIQRRQQRMRDRGSDEPLYLIYETAGDNRVRPAHRAWDRVTRPANDAWWDTHYPPNGYGCRCIVRTASRRQLEREGLAPTSDGKMPETVMERRINRSTGEIYPPTPAGIDVGFGHNVGKSAWFPSPGRFTDPGIGNQVAETAVSGPNFAKFISGEVEGLAPVGYVDAELAAAIGARVREVRLSSDSMKKQRERHPELTVDEYRLLPEITKSGRVIQDKENVLMFIKRFGKWYRATVKSTSDGQELFLVSFHHLRESSPDKLRLRGKVIREGE